MARKRVPQWILNIFLTIALVSGIAAVIGVAAFTGSRFVALHGFAPVIDRTDVRFLEWRCSERTLGSSFVLIAKDARGKEIATTAGDLHRHGHRERLLEILTAARTRRKDVFSDVACDLGHAPCPRCDRAGMRGDKTP